MKRIVFAATVAAAALAMSASGPAYAKPVDTAPGGATAAWMLANRDSGIDFAKLHRIEAMRNVLAADTLIVDRVAPAPMLTYAVLYTTTSPQALALGLARPSTKSIV